MVSRTKLIIVRHGKSVGNLERRFQGRDDSSLSDFGAQQAEAVRNKLDQVKLDAVYFSPLIRAKQTAEIAFGHRDMPMSASPELLERDFGLLDGMTLEEAKTKFPNIEDFYLGKIIETSVPGLEKIPVLQDRSVTAIRKLAYENKGKTIALVGHLFWIKSALSKILGVPFEEIQKKSVANCSITTLEAIFGKDVSFEVKDIGDKRHLQGLTKPKE